MLLRSIELENIKCFAGKVHIDLTTGRDEPRPHKWVVIYGDNGLGKSTLLKALGLSVTGQPALNPLLPSADGWVRRKSRYGAVRVHATKGPNDTSVGFPRQRPISLTWYLVGDRSTRIEDETLPAHEIKLGEGSKKVEQDDAKLLKTQIATDEKERGWLICGYGPHRRLTGAASDISETIPPDGRAARLVTLFHEKAALTSAERWLRDLDHRAKVRGGDDEARLRTIKSFIERGLLHEGVSLSEISPDGVFFDTPFGTQIPMAELSDGYRTVLALTIDLLRHVANAFDLLRVTDTSGEYTRVTAEGVVLIDEIDSHLHPSWQRTIGSWLHTRFPNMQFIVATHSPLIPTRVSVDEGMVIRLERTTKGRSQQHVVEPVTEEGQIGLTADQMLTSPNFGLHTTRDMLVEEMLAKIKELRRRIRKKKATPADRSKLEQLEMDFDRVAPAAESFAGIDEWNRSVDRSDDALRAVDE